MLVSQEMSWAPPLVEVIVSVVDIVTPILHVSDIVMSSPGTPILAEVDSLTPKFQPNVLVWVCVLLHVTDDSSVMSLLNYRTEWQE